MDRVFDLIYPPLYAIFISPAYALFRDNARIFLAIRLLNITAYSTLFVPVYQLLRRYSRWRSAPSAAAALLVVLSPCTLHYTRWILSEPLYIPLVAFTFLAAQAELHFGPPLENVLFGLLLASLPATKAVGNIPVLALLILVAAQLAGIISCQRVVRWRGALLTFVVFAAITFAERSWMAAILPQGGATYVNSCLSNPLLRSIYYWLDRVPRILAYLLISPGTAAGIFLLWLTVSRPARVLDDPLLAMTLLCWAGSVVVIPLFTPLDGPHIYHGRYLMPFALLPVVVGARYLDEFDKTALLAVAAVLMAFLLAGWPAHLDPFAAAYRDGVLSFPGASAWSTNAAFFLLILAPAWLLSRDRSAGLKAIAALMVAVAAWQNRVQSRDTGSVPFFAAYDCDHVGHSILGQLAADPATSLYVDDRWRSTSAWVQMARVMLIAPIPPRFEAIAEVPAMGQALLLTTEHEVPGATALVRGKEISLFRMP